MTGPLVQISTMCFLVELYFRKMDECGIEAELDLPELKMENDSKITVTMLLIIGTAAMSVLASASYLVTVNVAEVDSAAIEEIFGTTEIIAHKGYSSKAPENTMDAIKLAAETDPVTFVEIDVRTTKDGVPVVIHNASVADATGAAGDVYDYTYEELQQMPACYTMADTYPDARIPSLEEVLETYGNRIPLLIEIKGYDRDPELPGKIVNLLEKYDCVESCAIHSGDYNALKAVKEANPDVQCGLILALVTGNYYDLPCADFFSIEHTFVDKNTVNQLHKRGKKVYAWTVNYQESAEALKFTGVDGIITDVPEEVSLQMTDSNKILKDAAATNITNLTVDDDEAGEAHQNYQDENY